MIRVASPGVPRTICCRRVYGDRAYFGPEAEFFVFDEVRYGQDVNFGSYEVDSVEAHWNMASPTKAPISATRSGRRKATCPVPPNDTLMDLRSEMSLVMESRSASRSRRHHHEVATAGQCEIDMKFDTLLKMADDLIKYKYVVKNVARMHGKTATFMPKPLYGDNGSGMHVHQSIWNGDDPTFGDEGGYAKLSDNCRYYIGGLLKHAPAVLAFAAPTTNSYHRLVPGYEAPVNLAWSLRNRSAAVRIPMYSDSLKAKRCEFRCPDPSCEPLSRFLGHAHGRPGWHQEQDRSRRSGRQEHLRLAAGRTG